MKKPFFKTLGTQIIGIILLVVVIKRLFLPSIILHYANKTLANMDEGR